MTALSLLWLVAVAFGVQATPPALPLDIRVFRGATDVTRETVIAIFPAGAKTNGQRVPLSPSGERRVTLRTGQYDVQLVQENNGAVNGIAWSTLRLIADYPNEGHPQLEVLNFDKTYGALQVRPQGAPGTGTGTWSARLVRRDGSEVARGVAGQGYQVLVAPAGTYDVVIDRPGTPLRLHDVEVRAILTYVKSF